MRKLIRTLGLALAATILVAIPASAAPAVVVRDMGPCAIPGVNADGELDFGLYGVGAVAHVVQKDGRVFMTCKGNGITNGSGRGLHFSDFVCNSLTVDRELVRGVGSATISKMGSSTLECEATIPTE